MARRLTASRKSLGRNALASRGRRMRGNTDLYLLLLPTLVFFVIFHYLPMFGVVLAFKDFRISKGIWLSPWIGLGNFERLFGSFMFMQVLRNTLMVSFYTLAASFPIPIILALSINHVARSRFRKSVQTILYAPHFVSVVVIVAIMRLMLSPSTGVVNYFISSLGGEPIYFFAKPNWFFHLYMLSHVWQHTGFAAIIYIATLSTIDPNLYEAAAIDGAGKAQRILRIDLPLLTPTIMIILILSVGHVMNVGFEKVLLMQTPSNLRTSQIIATYVYEIGLLQGQFDFATAVGLFNSTINLLLLATANFVSRRVSGTGLI